MQIDAAIAAIAATAAIAAIACIAAIAAIFGFLLSERTSGVSPVIFKEGVKACQDALWLLCAIKKVILQICSNRSKICG